MFTTMTNDGDCKTGNDESGKKKNNQYSAHDVETNLEMEIGGEDVIIPGT